MQLPRAPRIPADLPVLYAVGTSDFAGKIANISRSGAHVVVEHFAPDIGTRIRRFISEPRERQNALEPRVVRKTPRGFCAQFLGTPVHQHELLADLGTKDDSLISVNPAAH